MNMALANTGVSYNFSKMKERKLLEGENFVSTRDLIISLGGALPPLLPQRYSLPLGPSAAGGRMYSLTGGLALGSA